MAMILLSLFLALGEYNPAYRVIYHLPGFNSFRIPAQIIFLYVFSIAALAGIGLDQVRQGGWEFRRGYLPFFCVGLGFLCALKIGIQFFVYPFFLKLFLLFGEAPVTFANLGSLYQRTSSSIDRSLILFLASFLFLLAIKKMKQNSSLMIFLTSAIVFVDLVLFGSQFVIKWQPKSSPTIEELIRHFPVDPSQGRVIAAGAPFNPNDGLWYRFPSILGYDPLMLKRYANFILTSQDGRLDNHVVNLGYVRDPSAKLLKLLHVREVVVNGEKKKVEKPMPYAAVVGGTKIVPADDVLTVMKGDGFDPFRTVILEAADMTEGTFQDTAEPVISSCIMKEYGHERIVLSVTTNQPGYLVLSEIFYPGWEARVDGKKTQIMRGNYLFRVIPVERGDHEVQLDFISWPFRIGALISLITIAASAGGLIRSLRRGKSRRR
jgi:hypothetical protein